MADNTANPATANMVAFGQFGSSFLDGDGDKVDLDGGSWTIQVPRRINKEKVDT